MTTIVAVRDGERTWIGSDTMANHCGTRLDFGPKWARHKNWAVGIAGDARTINIFQHHAERLLSELGGAFEFTQRFHDLLKECGYDLSAADREAPPNTAQDLLLASPAGIWSIPSDMSIRCVDHWVDGSGRGYGLGAMAAFMRQGGVRGGDMVKAVIEIAMEHDINTGGDIWVECLE